MNYLFLLLVCSCQCAFENVEDKKSRFKVVDLITSAISYRPRLFYAEEVARISDIDTQRLPINPKNASALVRNGKVRGIIHFQQIVSHWNLVLCHRI